MEYPVRCEIVDATGKEKGGLKLATPNVSRPHIGKQGLAELIAGSVRITLDDGSIIFGYECWWKPLIGKT